MNTQSHFAQIRIGDVLYKDKDGQSPICIASFPLLSNEGDIYILTATSNLHPEDQVFNDQGWLIGIVTSETFSGITTAPRETVPCEVFLRAIRVEKDVYIFARPSQYRNGLYPGSHTLLGEFVSLADKRPLGKVVTDNDGLVHISRYNEINERNYGGFLCIRACGSTNYLLDELPGSPVYNIDRIVIGVHFLSAEHRNLIIPIQEFINNFNFLLITDLDILTHNIACFDKLSSDRVKNDKSIFIDSIKLTYTATAAAKFLEAIPESLNFHLSADEVLQIIYHCASNPALYALFDSPVIGREFETFIENQANIHEYREVGFPNPSFDYDNDGFAEPISVSDMQNILLWE